MGIRVKYFASLREQIGRSGDELPASGVLKVMDVWRVATGKETLPSNVLIAVNMEFRQANDPVRDGDEVAFFPPITGG